MDRSTAAVRLLAGDKEPVRLASTSNLALAGLLTVDGVVSAAGDRILVKDQTSATENGIYTASEGTWRRAPDSNASNVLVAQMKVAVKEGLTNAKSIWSLATDRPDIGSDAIVFTLPPNGYIATSDTSLALSTGSKSFTTQEALAYRAGQRVRLISASSAGNYMEGQLTAYSGTSMTVLVDFVGPSASGTHADWTIVLAGEKGSGDMLSTNNLSDLSNKATARDNLEVVHSITAGTGMSVAGTARDPIVSAANSTPPNLLRNASMGLTTNHSMVMVDQTPVVITGFTTAVGAGSGVAQFTTTGGTRGLKPGKLVAIMGQFYSTISFIGTVTGGNTITATTAVFAQAPGDLMWIIGGTNTSPRTQFRVTASSSGGGTIQTVNGTLVNEASKTFTAIVIQGGYAISSTVNGMPQAGNAAAPAFYYYPLQVTSVGVNTFNATMAGRDITAGTTSTATAWEVTNGSQGTGNGYGPDWWSKDGSISFFKMREWDWDGITQVNKPGELYSSKLVKGIAGQEFFWQDLGAQSPAWGNVSNPAGLAKFLGKTVRHGAYIKVPNASQGRLYISDGITTTYSAYVTPGSLQWVEVTATISTSGTTAVSGFSLDAGSVGDTFIYHQPITVLGSGLIGEGNYAPGPASLKMFLQHVNPFYYLNRAIPASCFIRLEQETCGLIPTGMESIVSDVEGLHAPGATGMYLADYLVYPQMSALSLYAPPTGGGKSVNTQTVGVGRAQCAGPGNFYSDCQAIVIESGDVNAWTINIDYLGGVYS